MPIKTAQIIGEPHLKRWIVPLAILIVGVIGFFSAVRTIDTGKIGVVTQYGHVTGR